MSEEQIKKDADEIVSDMLDCQSNSEEVSDATHCALIAVRMVLDELETMRLIPDRIHKYYAIETELKSRI
jgi:hypothetical protein